MLPKLYTWKWIVLDLHCGISGNQYVTSIYENVAVRWYRTMHGWLTYWLEVPNPITRTRVLIQFGTWYRSLGYHHLVVPRDYNQQYLLSLPLLPGTCV